MNTIKLERINNNILRELSYILANDVADKNIKYVTVTAVKTSNDLSYAKVYITILNEEYKSDTLKALKSAKGYIKKELAHRIELRQIPDLDFVYDDSIEHGNSIENILKEINAKNDKYLKVLDK